jgi:hypothetical protein
MGRSRLGDRRRAPQSMYLVNFTRFHVRDEQHTEPVLSERRKWSAERSDGGRFRGGLLVALDGEEWLDIAIWEQPEQPSSWNHRDAIESEFVDRLDGSRVEILGLETGSLVFADPTRGQTPRNDL